MHERIRQLRIDKGLTQQELADTLGITQQAVGRWERGLATPDTSTLPRLADFFGVTVDYLLGRTDEPTTTIQQKQEQKRPKDLQKFLDQQQIMFDGVPLTEDDKEKIRKALELIFWDAKQKNKETRAKAKTRRGNK